MMAIGDSNTEVTANALSAFLTKPPAFNSAMSCPLARFELATDAAHGHTNIAANDSAGVDSER